MEHAAETAAPPRPWPAAAELAVDAVLFDLDGTLIDSTEATEDCWREWARRLGLDPRDSHPHGVPARDVVASRVAPPQVESALRLINELEATHTEGIRVKEGVRDFLDALPADRWAIVTSCTDELADVRLRAAGIAAPPVLVTADDVRAGKPDPEGYLAAARRLGVDPGRCLVVEDAPAGAAAGNAAGAWTLGITATYAPADLATGRAVGSLAGSRARLTDGGDLVLHFPAI